tara:strand:- start:110 stop:517 length:408 start_codon:yes stop_codon:yes gene_type:complete
MDQTKQDIGQDENGVYRSRLAALHHENVLGRKGLKAYDAGDYETALKQWKVLAEQGSDRAQFNLGVMYDEGEGVEQDYEEAANWYRKAAEHGHPEAQYNLAAMYYEGDGVEQDYEEALKWSLKSAKQGHRRLRIR